MRTTGRLMEQQIVQGCAWHHHTQPTQARSNPRQCRVTVDAFFQHDNRSLRHAEQTRLPNTHLDIRARRRGIGKHNRKRFFIAQPALSKQRNGFRVGCIARQMETTLPLDSENPSLFQECESLFNRISIYRIASTIQQSELRPALRATMCFVLMMPTSGAPSVALAFCTGRVRFQTRPLTRIRQGTANRVTRPAPRAVGKSITPTPAFRIKEFGKTIATNGRVMAHHRCIPATAAVQNIKIFGRALQACFADRNRIDASPLRRFVLQALDQILYPLRETINFDINAICVISDPALEVEFFGQTPNKGAKTDTLNHATDANPLANNF